ncbi:MAG: fibronectin type III-like domain-contianing protein, partial [Bacteroidales bacterium]|nr:fibronectin type III-like domain-contianing protein [Bacteroidales bacterium]
AFRKVFLRGGETRTVELTVEYPHLAFYSARGRWEVEEGEFTVFAGHSSAADLSDTFTVLSGVQGH